MPLRSRRISPADRRIAPTERVQKPLDRLRGRPRPAMDLASRPAIRPAMS